MNPSRRLLARSARVAIVLGTTLFANLVHADVSPNDRLVARTLFDEGRALMDAGNPTAACPKFAESMRLNPGGGTLLNLALCHETIGKTATAWLEFKDALVLARRDGRPEREKFATEHIAALQPRLSQLTVQVPEAARVPGLEVKLDGTQLGKASWGIELPADPGKHVVHANAPGKRGWEQTVEVAAEADRKTLTIPVLEDEAAAAPPPVAVPPPTPAPQRPLAIRDTGPEPPPGSDPLSHAGRIGFFLRGDIEGKGRGAVVVPGASYGLGDYVDAEAGGLIGHYKGFWVGANVYLLSGAFKPTLSAGVPVFFADGARPGAQGAAGLQWDPDVSYGAYLLVGATHFFSVPEGSESTVFVPTVGMQARL